MTLVEMSISASVLIAVTILLRILNPKRISKISILYIWQLIWIRALIPFHIPLEKIPVIRDRMEVLNKAALPAARTLVLDTVAIEYRETAQAKMLELPQILMLIWAIGVMIMLIRMLIIRMRDFKLLNDYDYIAVDNPYILQVIAEAKLRREVQVFNNFHIRSPMTIGVLRPKILIPEGFEQINPIAMRNMLLHELVHIKRWDVVKRFVMEMVLCIHWFNPMFWIMRRLYINDQEISCDEKVMLSMDEVGKKSYAETLLAIAANNGDILLAFPGFLDGKDLLKQRILSAIAFRKVGILGIIMTVVMFGCSLLTFASYTPVVKTQVASANEPLAQIQPEEISNTDQGMDNGNASADEVDEAEENKVEESNIEEMTETAEAETEFVRMSDEEYERVMNDIIENYNDLSEEFTDEQLRALKQQNLYHLAVIYTEQLERGEVLTEEERKIVAEYGQKSQEG